MKKIFIALSTLALTLLASAQNLYTQTVPDQVSTIRVEDHTRLTVKPSEGEFHLLTATASPVATIKGSNMMISSPANDITLLLPPGRSIAFHVEDHANLIFSGNFDKRQRLSVRTEDYASALFTGSLADSLWAVDLNLRADDYSLIRSEIRLVSYNFEFVAKDYSRINLDCQQNKYEPGFDTRTQTVFRDEHATLQYNYCNSDTARAFSTRDSTLASITQGKLRSVEKPAAELEKKRSFWRHRDVALNFAWGFHNWGTEPLKGFAGVDGPADARTSFNHVHLSVDYPLIGTRHTGLYIGLGLDWDKYKFSTPDVVFDNLAFRSGTDGAVESRLLTRYVVVPLTLRVDLWHGWRLTLSALPGIHWSGSHTGLRREFENDQMEGLVKDQSVNKHINPYKLDLRATLNYEGIGLYFQTATLSTMRDGCEPLYPVKFGIILTQD